MSFPTTLDANASICKGKSVAIKKKFEFGTVQQQAPEFNLSLPLEHVSAPLTTAEQLKVSLVERHTFTRDVELGSVLVPLESLEFDSATTKWLPLQTSDEGPVAEILVSIVITLEGVLEKSQDNKDDYLEVQESLQDVQWRRSLLPKNQHKEDSELTLHCRVFSVRGLPENVSGSCFLQLKCFEQTWATPTRGVAGNCVRFPTGSKVDFKADLLSDMLKVTLFERVAPSSPLALPFLHRFDRPVASRNIPLESLALDQSTTDRFELATPQGGKIEVLMALTLRNVDNNNTSLVTASQNGQSHRTTDGSEPATTLQGDDTLKDDAVLKGTVPEQIEGSASSSIFEKQKLESVACPDGATLNPIPNETAESGDDDDDDDDENENHNEVDAVHPGENILLELTVLRAFNPKRFNDDSHLKASSAVKIKSGHKNFTTSKEPAFEWNEKFYLVRKIHPILPIFHLSSPVCLFI